MIRNRNQQELNINLSLIDVKNREKEFFSKNP